MTRLMDRGFVDGLPIPAGGPVQAREPLLAEGQEDHLGVLGHVAGSAIDVSEHVLGEGRVGSQNSPVSQSRVSTTPVLPGIPVVTRRSSPGCRRLCHE